MKSQYRRLLKMTWRSTVLMMGRWTEWLMVRCTRQSRGTNTKIYTDATHSV